MAGLNLGRARGFTICIQLFHVYSLNELLLKKLPYNGVKTLNAHGVFLKPSPRKRKWSETETHAKGSH